VVAINAQRQWRGGSGEEGVRWRHQHIKCHAQWGGEGVRERERVAGGAQHDHGRWCGWRLGTTGGRGSS
jgi:hypothetical protein